MRRLYAQYGLCAALALAGAAASGLGVAAGFGAPRPPAAAPSRTAATSTSPQRPAAAFLSPPMRRRSVPFGGSIVAAAPGAAARSAPTTALRAGEDGDGGGDTVEWTAVVDSLRMYKAAYGDLKVPSRFVVPAMPPWPEAGWNLKLGQRVSAIRSTGKYVSSNEARRSALDSMGFLWRLRAPSQDKKMDGITFEQIYDALETYKEVVTNGPDDGNDDDGGNGKIDVPANFVVPNADPWPISTRGLPLGKKIPTVRSKAYLKANPGAADRLARLGFEFDGKVAANDQRYRRVYDALVQYKELNGDLLVPQPFVVPEKGTGDGDAGSSDAWPESMRGLRLGARVNAIRSQGTFVKTNPLRREELDSLGFVWDLPAAAGGKKRGRKKKVENPALVGLAPPGVLEGSTGAEESIAAPNDGAAEVMAAAEEEPAEFFATTFSPKGVINDDADVPLFTPFEGGSATPGGVPAPAEPVELAPPVEPASPQEPAQAVAAPLDTMSPTWAFEEDEIERAARASREAEEARKAAEEYSTPKDLSTQLSEAAAVAASVGVIREMTDSKRVQKGKIHKDIPWYIDDFGGDFVFEDVVEALGVYKEIYGTAAVSEEDGGQDGEGEGLLDVDLDFVVPDPAEALFGEAGEGGQGLRVPEDGSAPGEAGAGAGGGGDGLIAAEIERLELEMAQAQAQAGTGGQPAAAVAGAASPELSDAAAAIAATAAPPQPRRSAVIASWPEHLAGMRLGGIVRRIRDGSLEVKHSTSRRRALDALGFEWGDPKLFIDVPFEKTMCALLAYFQIRGDTMVYEDYVVPDEVPWPEILGGYELGEAVLRIRQLQNFFEAYHPDKVALLSMVDFYWFPEFALPLDPFSFGETAEDEFVAAVGVPFYWLGEQENYPAGITERLLADGPSEYPDDTAQWYNYDLVRDFWEGDSGAGSEVIRMFDETFGFHLPSYVLRRFGLPKLAKFQEAKFASGELGEIASERLEVEKRQDDLLRPILMSMSDLGDLKESYETLENARESKSGIDDATYDKERMAIERKVEDIVSRLQSLSRSYGPGGMREETESISTLTSAFGAKLATYEKQVEDRVENLDQVLKEKFPDHDESEWDARRTGAERAGAAEFARVLGDDGNEEVEQASLAFKNGEDVEEETLVVDAEAVDVDVSASAEDEEEEEEEGEGFDIEEEDDEEEDEEEEFLDEEESDDEDFGIEEEEA